MLCGILLFFVVEHTVTEALKFRVFYLLSELFAHTLVVLCFLPPAGAVAAPLLKPLLNEPYSLLVFIESNFHFYPFLSAITALSIEWIFFYAAILLFKLSLVVENTAEFNDVGVA